MHHVDDLLLTLLKIINVVMKSQVSDCTNRNETVYFNSVLKFYPVLEVRLNIHAQIVQNLVFDAIVVKLQD